MAIHDAKLTEGLLQSVAIVMWESFVGSALSIAKACQTGPIVASLSELRCMIEAWRPWIVHHDTPAACHTHPHFVCVLAAMFRWHGPETMIKGVCIVGGFH
jgi:hypothetical protein